MNGNGNQFVTREILREELERAFLPIYSVLAQHTAILNEHTRILNEHTDIINEHTRILVEHSRMHAEHQRRFDRIDNNLAIFLKNQTDLDLRHEHLAQFCEKKIGYQPLN